MVLEATTSTSTHTENEVVEYAVDQKGNAVKI